jgi:hypothetical protein
MNGHFICGIAIGFVLTAFGLTLPSVLYEAHKWQSQAVERGYAEYNPKTGEWGWK